MLDSQCVLHSCVLPGTWLPPFFSFFNSFCQIVFFHCTVCFHISFLLGFLNACYSTLMSLTDTHSHHNLTTHILYPLCTLRAKIQISWLLMMHPAIMHNENPNRKQKHIPSTGPLHSPPNNQSSGPNAELQYLWFYIYLNLCTND